jgi:hypothetical protein
METPSKEEQLHKLLGATVAGTDRIFKLVLHLLLLLVVKPTGDRKQAREEKFSLGEEIIVIGGKPPCQNTPTLLGSV